MLENDIVNEYVSYLINVVGVEKEKIVLEQPLSGSGTRVDLIYKKDNKLIGIEFKRFDFNKVFHQAMNLRYSFNKVFICYLAPKNSDEFDKKIKKCKEWNIGLITYNEKTKKFITHFEPKDGQILLHIYVNKNNEKNNWKNCRLFDILR